jgi:hypothetical protein
MPVQLPEQSDAVPVTALDSNKVIFADKTFISSISSPLLFLATPFDEFIIFISSLILKC